MRVFILKFALVILPVIFTLMVVNYWGDAAKIFDKKYLTTMSQILGSGRYVTNIENYDDRLFQKEYILNYARRHDTLVLGSSRTMQIHTKAKAKKGTLFNHSVSGASIEDLIAIYQMYKEQNILPKTLILGIDPWTFNEHNDQNRWVSIGNYYYEFLQLPHEIPSVFKNYQQLFSFSYFQSSIKELPQKVSGRYLPIATTQMFNEKNTKLDDGSLVYGSKYRNASPREVEQKILSFINGEVYGLKNFDKISSNKWNDFLKLMKDLQCKKINIVLFLSPYAPKVYDKLEQDYPLVMKSENRIREFADSQNISVLGSFNPYLLNLSNEYFYDGMHCNEKGMEKILFSTKID